MWVFKKKTIVQHGLQTDSPQRLFNYQSQKYTDLACGKSGGYPNLSQLHTTAFNKVTRQTWQEEASPRYSLAPTAHNFKLGTKLVSVNQLPWWYLIYTYGAWPIRGNNPISICGEKGAERPPVRSKNSCCLTVTFNPSRENLSRPTFLKCFERVSVSYWFSACFFFFLKNELHQGLLFGRAVLGGCRRRSCTITTSYPSLPLNPASMGRRWFTHSRAR